MAIEFGALKGVLTSPTKTFERLKDGANVGDGLKLLVLTLVIYNVISIVGSAVQLMRLPAAFQGMASQVMVMTVIMSVIMIALGIGMFLLFSWMVAKLTASIGNKVADFGKTVGLLSYVNAALMLFIMVPIMIIGLLIGLAAPPAVTAYGVTQVNPADAVGMMALGVLMLVGVILLIVWMVLLEGRAAAMANGTTWGAGIAGVIVTYLILLVIAFVIGMILMAIFLAAMSSSISMAGSFNPAGFAFGGL